MWAGKISCYQESQMSEIREVLIWEPPCWPPCQLWWPGLRQSWTHRKSPQPERGVFFYPSAEWFKNKLTATKPEASASSRPSCTWATKSPGPGFNVFNGCSQYQDNTFTSEPCLSVTLGAGVAPSSCAWDQRMNPVGGFSQMKRWKWKRMGCKDA